MRKAQIIAILERSGFETESAHEVYAVRFKGVHHSKHMELMKEWAKDEAVTAILGEGSDESGSQEKTMSYNTTDSKIEETMDFGHGITVQVDAEKVERDFGGDVCNGLLVVTCANCKDGVITVGEESGKTAQHAINAATDAFYYRDYIPMYTHIEPGLRLEMPLAEFEALVDDGFGYKEGGIGIAGRHYSGKYLNLSVKGAYWRNIAVNFGQTKTTRHWMSNNELLKQNFIDSILLGYTISVDLQKVGWNWLVTVMNNLLDPDKDAAFARYWAAKAEAGTVEKAKKATRTNNRRVNRLSNSDDTEKVEKADELAEKAEFVYVKVGNNKVVHAFEATEDMPLLKTGKYDVLNTRGSKKLSARNYTGTTASLNEFRGYAVMGYTLVAC